jgi:hypothetical protein
MADFNAASFDGEFNIDSLKSQSPTGDYGGKVRCMYDSWGIANESEEDLNNPKKLYNSISPNDTISCGKLPPKARILRIDQTSVPAATLAKIDASGASSALAVGDRLDKEHDIEVTLTAGEVTGYLIVEYALD